MATLEVPDDEKLLPRLERRHPFRALNNQERAEVRQAAGEAIEGVTAMIRQIVTQRAPPGLCWADIEDVEQEVRVNLLKALTSYDRTYKVKVSTFLRSCIVRATYAIFRSLGTRRARARFCSVDDISLVARDESSDSLVESLADRVHREPELLGKHGRTLLNTPTGTPDAQTAASLGIAPSTLGNARFSARIRAVRLLDEAEEEIFERHGEVSKSPPLQMLEAHDADSTEVPPTTV